MLQVWGRYHTRNPQTGFPRPTAEIYTPEVAVAQPWLAFQQLLPELAVQLQQLGADLEQRSADALTLDFEVDQGQLLITAQQPLERSAAAACKIAVALVGQSLISREQALLRVEVEDLRSMLRANLEHSGQVLLAQGQPLAPGVASGRVVYSEAAAAVGEGPVILVCDRLTYAQRDALDLVSGVVVRTGSALAARHRALPCIAVPDLELSEGQTVSLDGGTGRLYAGELPLLPGGLSADALTLLEWADAVRTVELRANVSSLEEAQQASAWGAQGVGLCRLEAFFQVPHRLPLFQKVLRQICYEQLPASPEYARLTDELSREIGVLLSTTSGAFNLRLLDSPLSQMLGYWRASGQLSEDYFAGVLSDWLQELNPMQGMRCGRLSLLYPQLLDLQLRAIVRAWSDHPARLQVMLPGVCAPEELRIFKRRLESVVEQEGGRRPQVASMLETPRACLLADQLGGEADFLSFGTGDLTEATCGISRYDSPLSFLPGYLEQGIFQDDPFATIDQPGVGALMQWACERVKAKCPSVEMGTCGAQAVDPESLRFCLELGLQSVSVPLIHLPGARLAAAQASLKPGSLRLQLPRLSHRS